MLPHRMSSYRPPSLDKPHTAASPHPTRRRATSLTPTPLLAWPSPQRVPHAFPSVRPSLHAVRASLFHRPIRTRGMHVPRGRRFHRFLNISQSCDLIPTPRAFYVWTLFRHS